jgi:predicted nucleic acid-binding protein
MALIDSNIIIYASKPENIRLRELLLKPDSSLSLISKVEVLGYHALHAKDKVFFESVFEVIGTYDLSIPVIEGAVELRQKYNMSLGDALIAATCLYYRETLYTANTGDFKKIKGIKITNPI